MFIWECKFFWNFKLFDKCCKIFGRFFDVLFILSRLIYKGLNSCLCCENVLFNEVFFFKDVEIWFNKCVNVGWLFVFLIILILWFMWILFFKSRVSLFVKNLSWLRVIFCENRLLIFFVLLMGLIDNVLSFFVKSFFCVFVWLVVLIIFWWCVFWLLMVLYLNFIS